MKLSPETAYALNNDLVSDQFVSDPDVCGVSHGDTVHVKIRQQALDFHQGQFATAIFCLRQVLSVHS